MAELAPWAELVIGSACPLCPPRAKYTEFIYFVRKLAVSSLYLSRNQAYQKTCSLIYDMQDAVSISVLTSEQWRNFADDLQRAEQAIQHVFKPDHLNIEGLGNSVPHLHFHIVPRYRSDPQWGRPIWMTGLGQMADVRLDEPAYARLAWDIDQALEHVA